MTSRLAAVILAGGEQDALALQEGVRSKALIGLGNKALAAYVIEALRQAESIFHISYIGPISEELRAQIDAHSEAGKTLAESLGNGLELAQKQYPEAILFVTADLPWLTAQGIEAFCQSPAADLVYAAITKARVLEQFPEQKRTFVRFKEGSFTGGNVLLLKPGAETQLLPFVNQLYASRKNPLGLAKLVGFGTLIQLALGNLPISSLEKRVSQVLNLKARVFISEDPGLGADIDKPEHLAQARKLHSKQA
ncbi:MAG: NTP transferase domain-containing protein [Trueperaceae bacterium]|nr:NTP transferase domain-containing protein [Trueperaceae bacterium]